MKIQLKLGLFLIGPNLISGRREGQNLTSPTYARHFDDTTYHDNPTMGQALRIIPEAFDNTTPARLHNEKQKMEETLREAQFNNAMDSYNKDLYNQNKRMEEILRKQLKCDNVYNVEISPPQPPLSCSSKETYQNRRIFDTPSDKQNNSMKYIIAGIIIGALALTCAGLIFMRKEKI